MDNQAAQTVKILRLHPRDNVAVTLEQIQQGSGVAGIDGVASATVPRGHKISLHAIAPGEAVLKYGQVIGVATMAIAPGEHVHTHNMAMSDERVAATAVVQAPIAQEPRSFQGYRRSDGRVGTRNYIGILSSVNCSATVARHIAEAAERSGMLDRYANIDGIVPITHSSGCAMDSAGEGFDLLRRTLWGTAVNPNFAAFLIIGLGCEVIQVAQLVRDYGLRDQSGFKTLTIQEAGGTRLAIERGLAELETLLPAANAQSRSTVPASELVVGLQCGGSDGWSGITSNPALGNAVDRLVALGGTAILSETPEIYGAEHLLYARASEETAALLRSKLNWWEHYTNLHGAKMDNNPSPGNRAGGLTTILEKSLGAVAKAGTVPLSDVIGYAERLRSHGLVFMDSPGFDPCSATGQVASGATLIVFTTGRGSTFGYKPTPSIKLSSNTSLYERMSEDIDLDCGGIATGTTTIEERGAAILDQMLAIASGDRTKSEALGYGGAEFVPWLLGATM